MTDSIRATTPSRVRFGPFEADLKAGELRRRGRRLSLQEKPFVVLEALLQRPGEAVTRKELRDRLWPDEEFGDFDHGLNNAVNKLRIALGDSASRPRFIETVGRGYRFIGAIDERVAQLWTERTATGSASIAKTEGRPAARVTETRAYELYLQGEFHAQRTNPAAYARAVEYYEQALALDPQLAAAHAGLALARLRQEAWGYEQLRGQSEEVKGRILRAFALDPDLPEAHAVLGLSLRYYDWDWLGSEAAFKRALQLEPSLAMAHVEYCCLLQELARFDEAIAEAGRALTLHPRMAFSWVLEGRVLYRVRRYREAEARYLRALELEPGFGMALEHLTELHLIERRFPEARRTFAELEQVPSHRQLTPLRAHLAAATGDAEAARRLLQEVDAFSFPKGLRSAAAALSLLGNHEGALAVLHKAVTTWMIQPLQFGDPELDPLRERPRFRELLEWMGLPPQTVETFVHLPAVTGGPGRHALPGESAP